MYIKDIYFYSRHGFFLIFFSFVVSLRFPWRNIDFCRHTSKLILELITRQLSHYAPRYAIFAVQNLIALISSMKIIVLVSTKLYCVRYPHIKSFLILFKHFQHSKYFKFAYCLGGSHLWFALNYQNMSIFYYLIGEKNPGKSD